MMSEPRAPKAISPPAELQARIRAAIAQTKAPRMRVGMRLILAFGVCVLCAGAVAMRVRPNLAALPIDTLLLSTGGILAVVAAALICAASPGKRGLGAPVATLAAVAIGAAPLYACLAAASPAHPAGADLDATGGLDALVHGGLPCFVIALVVGGVSLIALAYALRHAVPAAPVARGAALGAASGALSGLALQLHCPSFTRMHILLAHAAPIVILALLGAVLAPRILRP